MVEPADSFKRTRPTGGTSLAAVNIWNHPIVVSASIGLKIKFFSIAGIANVNREATVNLHCALDLWCCGHSETSSGNWLPNHSVCRPNVAAEAIFSAYNERVPRCSEQLLIS